MRRRQFMRTTIGLAALLAASASYAQTGVNDDRVSLPEGPGSLEGIGDNASINAAMGSMSFAVPIDVPEGFEGVTPSLSLNYSSSGPAGITGIGWDVSVPYIERMTNWKLPGYHPDDDIVANGGQQLVRVADDAGFAEYRARIEGGFSRYRWRGVADGTEGFWTEETPDGVTRFYGAAPDGEIDEASVFRGRSDGIFRWHLRAVRDQFGHRAEYDYVEIDGLPYLDSIQYIYSAGAPSAQVRFEYEAREDRISDARSGRNELRTRRLTAVDVFSEGVRIWRYALTYEAYSNSGGLSRLSRVERFGVDNEPHPIVFDFDYSESLGAVCAQDCGEPYLVELGALGVNLGAGDATFVDLNGDALPDIVDTAQPGGHRIFMNGFDARGAQRFAAATRSATGTRASHQIGSPYVQVLDVNGDGRADLTNVQTGEVLYNLGDGDWSEAEALDDVADLPDFGEGFAVGAEELAQVRFFDFDNDRRMDVLRSTDATTDIYQNRGAAGFAVVPDVERIGAGFAEQRLEMADMNGDGLLDPVLVRAGAVRYRLNLGMGEWTAWRDIEDLPFNEAQLDFVELEDINGDSLDDIVFVLADSLHYALNRGGDHFDRIRTIREVGGQALPQRVDGTTVHFADMNGSGSDDIVWITAAGEVLYMELFPQRPNLLTRITNGLGMVTEVTYATSVEQAANSDEPWAYTLPFPMVMAASIDTYDAFNDVHQVTRYDYRDAYYDANEKAFRGFAQVDKTVEGDARQEGALTLMTYDVGDLDRYRAGKQIEERLFALGDGAPEPIRWTVNTWEDCPLEAVPADGLSYPIRHVCQTATDEGIIERSPADAVTLRTEMTYDGFGNVVAQAALGVTSRAGAGCGVCDRPDGEYGAPCGPTCAGDEQYTWTDYVHPDDADGRWMLNKPTRERSSADPAAGAYSETLTYYDGQPFVGLPMGQLTLGLESRMTTRVGDGEIIETQRQAFDVHGNVVESLSPRGEVGQPGHRQRHALDAEGLLVVRTTKEVIDPTGQPYALERRYSYDSVWGKIASATSWVTVKNGQDVTTPTVESWRYDALGRIFAEFAPGDMPGTPSTEYRYSYGNPVSRVTVLQRRTQNARLPDTEVIRCMDGFGRLVQTRSRVAPNRYLVDRFVHRNRRNQAVQSWRPYESESAECDRDPPAMAPVANEFDVLGRVAREVRADVDIYGSASVLRRERGPLMERIFDEHDTDPQNAHANTPIIRHTDGLGRLVTEERVLEAGQPGLIWRLAYDVYGTLRRVEDPDGNARLQSWDAAGRLVEVDDPDRGLLQLSYDVAGQIIRRDDAAGRVVRMEYDALDRVVSRFDGDDREGTEVRLRYDDPAACDADCDHTAGKLVSRSYPFEDGRSVERFTYDEQGRQTGLSREFAGAVLSSSTEFDHLGDVIAERLPDGTQIDYTLDGAGRITAIPGVVDAVIYGPEAHVVDVQLANGVSEPRRHDVTGRITQLSVTGDAGPLAELRWSYDRMGLIDAVESPGADGPSFAARYRYDAMRRLSAAVLNPDDADLTETLSYAYAAGMRLTSKRSDRPGSPHHVGALTYGDAGPNAVTQAGALALEYDPAGFLEARGEQVLSWDYQGRLTRADRDDASTAFSYAATTERLLRREGPKFLYSYGPLFEIEDGMSRAIVNLGDRRVAVLESANLAAQVLSDVAPADGDGELQPVPNTVIDAGDAVVARRVADGEAELVDARRVDPPRRLLVASARRVLLEGTPRRTFHHHDTRGSLLAVTDDDGQLLETRAYTPFGGEQTTPQESARGFDARERDRSTGLLYVDSRYHDPLLARFISPDILFDTADAELASEQPFNVTGAYHYAANNPVSFEDEGGFADKMKGADESRPRSSGRQPRVLASVQGFRSPPPARSQTFNALPIAGFIFSQALTYHSMQSQASRHEATWQAHKASVAHDLATNRIVKRGGGGSLNSGWDRPANPGLVAKVKGDSMRGRAHMVLLQTLSTKPQNPLIRGGAIQTAQVPSHLQGAVKEFSRARSDARAKRMVKARRKGTFRARFKLFKRNKSAKLTGSASPVRGHTN